MKNTKKIRGCFLASIIMMLTMWVVLLGCNSSVDDNNDALLQQILLNAQDTTEYGSLRLVSSSSAGDGSEARFIDINATNRATVTVKGLGMKTITQEGVVVGGGKGGTTIEKIPVGKNRIVTIQGYKDGSVVTGLTLYAVTDIVAGENTISVDAVTSRRGKVYATLIEGGVTDFEGVDAAVPNVNVALIDAVSILADKKAGALRAKERYVLETSTVVFDVGKTKGASLRSVQRAAGSTITVHAKDGYIAIHYWDGGNGGLKTSSPVAMTAETGGWYAYTIEDTSKKVIFTKKVGGWDSQTSDLSIGAAGEYWFVNGSFTTAKPADYTATGGTVNPPTPAPTATYRVYLTGSSWTGVKAYYYSGDETQNNKWPGVAMTQAGSDLYIDMTESWVKAGDTKIIFYSNDTNRYPADKAPGETIPAGVTSATFDLSTKTWKTSSGGGTSEGDVSSKCGLEIGTEVYIGDPLSEKFTVDSSTGEEIKIECVAPGTWDVYKKISGTVRVMGKVVVPPTTTKGAEIPQTVHKINLLEAGSDVPVVPVTPAEPSEPSTPTGGEDSGSGGGTDSDADVTPGESEQTVKGKIIVHAKYKVVYYWKDGSSGTAYDMTAESGGWYTYTINETSVNLLFKNDKNSWDGKTGDLVCKEGEWWYNGEWLAANPDDTTAPVLTTFTSDKTGTVAGEVTFTIEATDNGALKSAEIKDGENTLKVIGLSGKSCKATWKWDTAKARNGTHTVTCMVTDIGGNKSAAKSVSLTTKNANLPPIAVISGPVNAKTGSEKVFSGAGSCDQNGGTITYKWTVQGATVKSGAGTDTLTVTMPASVGTVKVTLEVTDDEGAKDSTTQIVNVKENTSSGDFRDETIYFLMTTRFYDGDKSNNEYCWDEGGEYLKIKDGDPAWRGDFKGLAEKLDYIKALGFSAVWITPVVENASGIDYHGYHAYDFSRVDPRYESTGFKYQDLINACHAKGLKVIQDIVLNHTGNWGEKNLFHMFKKAANTTAKTGTTGGKMSPIMEVDDTKGYIAKSMGSVAAYESAAGGVQYERGRIGAMKTDSIDTEHIYHHSGSLSWNGYSVQTGQIAGDCVDLNTENPDVMRYLIDCYKSYIDMGVDAFRVDTVKHISRWTLNQTFNKEIIDYAGENFYMFGEVCARYRGRVNENCWSITPAYYTWKDSSDPAWGTRTSNEANAEADWTKNNDSFNPPTITGGANYLLVNNTYRTPDLSKRSHMDVIDFYMHWAFNSVNDAFQTGLSYDADYCDPTWVVTYVDSHDYAPDNAPENKRFMGTWPDKLNLMFTFRGIPCIYYGSEIEFKKGLCIDPPAERTYLDESGRAYFGDNIEGTVTATDFGTYTASGAVKETLKHPLAQHIRRLNQIRRAIPALQKGQYSTEGCSGSIAFKRRYTDSDVDSFALVTINGGATFTGIPAGEYIEVVTGKRVTSTGSLTSDSIGQDNMRVYVLTTGMRGCEVTGKIGADGTYLK